MTNWQTKKLGDVLEKIEGGGTPSKEKKEFWNGSIPWASVKDLTSFNPKETQDYITDEGLKNSSSRLVKAGTLITPTRMALGFTVRFDVDVAINQDLKALYPIDDVSTEFIQYWFEAYRKSIERLGTGSTVAGIQIGELRALKIQVPEKPEQERIVGVLEVWDEYIEKLEQKIALKEQLKKGLMQQLLTGKRRLPGFSEEWQTMKIGEIGEIFTGNTPSMQDDDNYGGEFGWVTAEDFSDKYIANTRMKLSEQGKRLSRWLPAGSVLVTCIASIGKNAIAAIPLATNQQINSIVVNNENDNEFIYYFLTQNKNLLLRYAGSGALPILNKGDFSKIKIFIPSDYQEQLEISRVISSADEEIYQLKNRLGLIKIQKKYLLKNLITGTIRTPEDLKPLDTIRLERSAL